MKNYLGLIFIAFLLVTCKTKEKSNFVAKLEYNVASKLGEGAVWNYKTNELYWIDIEGEKLCIYNPEKKENTIIKMPSRIGTVVPSEEKDIVIVALKDGIYTVNINTSELTVLSDVEANIKENRFNDGKCDPNGNLWVGSMHLEQSKPNANLYRINEFGEAKKMVDNITISNGIVWTNDKKTMYYIDTPTKKIRAFDYDETTSTISNERVVVEVDEKDGYPDGMTIDENDMLWVGMWNGNAVAKFNPKTGKLIDKIKVPAHNVTSCAFGGVNLDEMYITTASVDMTKEEKEKYPLAGSVFKVKLHVKGVKSSFFKKRKTKTIQAN